MMRELPIDAVIPDCVAGLLQQRNVVVTAAPGAGKSTRVPPALAAALPGQILVLEPRRIAARALATRIAEERGWTLGGEVGYQVRHEKVGTARTKLWVLTEGVLTRRLGSDPFLEGVSAVVLDEFHERHLHSDLALAWCREVQRTVRDDLHLCVMSATIDPAPVRRFLADCPVIDAAGRPFPVRIEQAAGRDQRRLEDRVAAAVRQRLADPDGGDVLVFVAGVGEIRACVEALRGVEAEVLPLHGQLPPDEQDRCLRRDASSRRRVIIATNVAETSLTIPGVRSVIDSGEHRLNRFDAISGIDTLALEPIGAWSAQQRAGRAGRTAPGVCVRLWSQLEDHGRPAATDPEIERCDVAATLLALKGWGVQDARTFPWFQPPQRSQLERAEQLCARLGLCAEWGALTEDGHHAVRLGVHPRLARLLLEAQRRGAGAWGASLAALCSGRDIRLRARGPSNAPMHSGDNDVLDDLALLDQAVQAGFDQGLRQHGIDPNAARELHRDREEYARMIGAKAPRSAAIDDAMATALLLSAFPDRVSKRSARDSNRVAVVGGLAAELDAASGLATRSGSPRGELILAVRIQAIERRRQASDAVIVRAACALDDALIDQVFPNARRRRTQVVWNEQRQVAEATVGWWYEDLCLKVAVGSEADPAEVAAVLCAALSPTVRALIAAEPAAASFVNRAAWLRAVRPDLDIPEFSDARLRAILPHLCANRRARSEVSGWIDWLRIELSDPQLVDRLAPETITVPTGNAIALDYSNADAQHPPILAVRLQELFGLGQTPRINDGRTPVLLHLLAPNYRPQQVTSDLASFWANTYAQVRKDLRGRYPKHHWPDDPLAALPTARAKRRGE